MLSTFVVPMAMHGATRTDMTGCPYTTYGGHTVFARMPLVYPVVGGLDHSRGKWFAPGEPVPPSFVITHPPGHNSSEA